MLRRRADAGDSGYGNRGHPPPRIPNRCARAFRARRAACAGERAADVGWQRDARPIHRRDAVAGRLGGMAGRRLECDDRTR